MNDLIEQLRDEQAARCVYGTREGDGRTCDCKYGAHVFGFGGEQTGCPELRTAIWILTRDVPTTARCDRTHGDLTESEEA